MQKNQNPALTAATERLAAIIRPLAMEQRPQLERWKQNQTALARPDFLWHYLLHSFATMGRSAGAIGLIENPANYQRLQFDTLSGLADAQRAEWIRAVCREAKIRMPDKKAMFIASCFDYIVALGGVARAREELISRKGRDAKLHFLQSFPGIGPKYARNIMMDVYHPEFRDCIAIDVRIKSVSETLGLSFENYATHEAFYLGVASRVGVNGWELDRLLYHYRETIEACLRRNPAN